MLVSFAQYVVVEWSARLERKRAFRVPTSAIIYDAYTSIIKKIENLSREHV